MSTKNTILDIKHSTPIANHVKSPNYQTTFVDKLTSFAISSDIARIGFSVEDHIDSEMVHTQTLVMPIKTLVELYEFLDQSLKSEEVQTRITAERVKLFDNLK